MEQRLIGLFGLLALMNGAVLAQPHVDITMADNGAGQLEIRLRPDGDFNELVSNVVFTIRWQEQYGPALSMIDLVYPQSEFLPLAPTPLVNGGNGYLYRTFNAVALSTMSEFGHSWVGGMEYPVCTLQVLTPGVTPEIVNDAFTQVNNRNFFVSLNGISRTGSIYPDAPPLVNALAVNNGAGSIEVRLSPESNYFGWVNSVDFAVRWPATGANLGEIVQDNVLASLLPVQKIGPEVVQSGFVYQRFHGAGSGSLAVSGTGWFNDNQVVLMQIPIIGSMGEPVVADDPWTQANAADYSIVLNGQQRAGQTDDDLSTGLDQEVNLITRLTISEEYVSVLLAKQDGNGVALSLLNASGQLLEQQASMNSGSATFSLAGLAHGVYTLVATAGTASGSYRFVH